MQNRIRIFFLILIFALIPVSSAAAVDEEIAVYVDGVGIPESLVASRVNAGTALNTGMSSEEKEAALAQARKTALLNLITEQVCLNEAERLGLDKDPGIAEETEVRYEKMIGSVESYIRSSYPNLDRDAMDEQVDSLLNLLGESRESYRETAARYALISALENYWLERYPDPTPDAVRAYYDELYSRQKERFDADENAFESAMLNGELVLYRPTDLKLIRKAEFLFDDDVIKFLRQARQLGVSNADVQIQEHYHMLADQVEPIYEALLNGETTFDEVLENIEEGSSARVNYFHPSSTRFNQEYYDRANAFTEIGEISTAYLITNGYAVLEYYGDIPAGELTVEESSEAIREMIIRESSKEYLTAMKQDLLEKAEIVFVSDGE